MAKKKRYRGHYCKVCGQIKSNESFSGKGHRDHICKKCSRKSPAGQTPCSKEFHLITKNLS
ncbi:MAG: hypothetical protein FIA99_17325 [Ruminiclostridium sp.]|nr:hypothetical protein [Ruminiclostridium sp.]